MKRKFPLFLFLVMMVLALLSGACSQKEPILIGFSAGLTGRNAALGVDGRDGALLAVETLNKKGGVKGRTLELVVRDDLSTDKGALAADLELKEAGVVAIVGHMTSETMMAAWSQMKDADILYLSPTVSTPQLQGIKDNFYRLIVVNSYPASQLALHAADSMRLKSVVVFYDADNFAYTNTFVEGFSDQFQKAEGKIEAVYEFRSSDEPDFRPMLEEAKGCSPDGILIVASAVDTALIAQQANLVGLDAQLLTSNWAFTEDLLQNGGRVVEGILSIVSNDVNNQSQEYLDFASRFRERFNREPTFAAGYGYEAIEVLASALEKTDGKPHGLGEALLEIRNFSGVHGQIQFDEFGDVERTLYMIAVKNGEFETVQTLGIPSP